MNPYNFVPLGPPAERKSVHFHHKFHGLTGTLTCRIQTLTHFFTAAEQERVRSRGHQELKLLRENGAPVIPGSSLKGAIRSVAEAISGSCLVLAPRGNKEHSNELVYKHGKRKGEWVYYPFPQGFFPCGSEEKKNRESYEACPACRMFGYLHRRELFGGNVSFESAHIMGNYRTETLTLEPFGSPAPRHRPFYGTPDSEFREIRGRKFYYHRIEGARTTRERNDFNKTVEAVIPGAVFEFSVNYENLSEEELALLIYALVLEEPMRHKIGMGKGVGLGSVRITIIRWEQRDMQNRYRQFGGGTTVLTDEALQAAIEEQIQAYHQYYAPWKESLTALRDILTWDGQHPRDTRYPTREWFKANPNVPLEEVIEDVMDNDEVAGGDVRDTSMVKPQKSKPEPPAPPTPVQPEPFQDTRNAAAKLQGISRNFDQELWKQIAECEYIKKIEGIKANLISVEFSLPHCKILSQGKKLRVIYKRERFFCHVQIELQGIRNPGEAQWVWEKVVLPQLQS